MPLQGVAALRLVALQLFLHLADGLLDLATDAIGGAFALRALVTHGTTYALLDATLQLVHLALELVVVHLLLLVSWRARMRAQPTGGAKGVPAWTLARDRLVLQACPPFRFTTQQDPLAFHPPAIAGQVAIAPHHPVAGNRHRERIGGAGTRHGADRARHADPLGHRRVAAGLADRNLLQRLPDPLLERGAPDIERQVHADAGVLHPADALRDDLLEVRVAPDQVGPGEAVLQPAQQSLRIVAQLDRADAALALRDEDRAERTLADGEADGGTGAAIAKARRLHAEDAVGPLVETAVGAEARLVDRIGDGSPARQLRADPAGAMRLGVRPRGQPGRGLEDAMEVEGTEVGFGGERRERRRRLRVRDAAAGGRNELPVALHQQPAARIRHG